MEKEIMNDVKKFQQAEKLKKQRDESQSIPYYFDGLESLCDRIHPTQQLLQISDVKLLSHDTKLIRLIPAKPNKPLAPFRAGQYIGLTVEIDGVRTARPYSIVSSPNQLAYYELGIKRKPEGFVSCYLYDRAKVGDIFGATEPLGNLYYNRLFHGDELVFIAGGCGVTPFISMFLDISERLLPFKVNLIFGCLTEKDILFRDLLEDLQSRRSNIQIHYVLSEPDSDWRGECGFITKEVILKVIGSVKNKYFYIVGNRAMYQFIDQELTELKIPKHKIFYEAYGVPDDITKIIGWPDEITSSEKVRVKLRYRELSTEKTVEFDAYCTEPLLNSIERQKIANIQVKNGCRSGECAFCRTKMDDGKVFVPPNITLRQMDGNFGFIHPCVSYPLTDIQLDLTRI
jgi:ferredoxin-NADP reductase/ferredoxin